MGKLIFGSAETPVNSWSVKQSTLFPVSATTVLTHPVLSRFGAKLSCLSCYGQVPIAQNDLFVHKAICQSQFVSPSPLPLLASQLHAEALDVLLLMSPAQIHCCGLSRPSGSLIQFGFSYSLLALSPCPIIPFSLPKTMPAFTSFPSHPGPHTPTLKCDYLVKTSAVLLYYLSHICRETKHTSNVKISVVFACGSRIEALSVL